MQEIQEIISGIRTLNRILQDIDEKVQQKDLYRDIRTCIVLSRSLQEHLIKIDATANDDTEERRGGTTTSSELPG
jgi:hypothetical protein